MNKIDSTAIIHPNAIIGMGNTIGPGVIIGPDVILGDDNYIGPYVVIGEPGEYRNPPEKRETELAVECGGDVTEFQRRPLIIIRNKNRLSEFVNVQMPVVTWRTVIENDCMIMAKVHVAHDCHIHDHVTIAPCTVLGGKVVICERANVGIGVNIHPRIAIGQGAMIGMNATITEDVPMWRTVVGVNKDLGWNERGMRKAGMKEYQIRELTDWDDV